MSELSELLRAREIALHTPSVRKSAFELNRLLAPGFREFGKSGRVYNREQVISALLEDVDHKQIDVKAFKCDVLSDNVALVTYRSEAGNPITGALRSSIWQKNQTGWQMVFHQGTIAQSEQVTAT
ncbi:DUF4440 domain-containing protein [Candidatus Raskinella chloraquaticus]|uniref:nuclear transport factor 2 family protein n=1 Tax=Candidatus Raskinella chloraquaticus TaxID=1951219 RepID=UPI0036718DD1